MGPFYRDYKGFYLKNYESYYPNWNKDSLGYPKSPSLLVGLSLKIKKVYISAAIQLPASEQLKNNTV